MKTPRLNTRFDHICEPCAVVRGGSLRLGKPHATVKKACPYCKVVDTLWPWVDFEWQFKNRRTK